MRISNYGYNFGYNYIKVIGGYSFKKKFFILCFFGKYRNVLSLQPSNSYSNKIITDIEKESHSSQSQFTFIKEQFTTVKKMKFNKGPKPDIFFVMSHKTEGLAAGLTFLYFIS